VSSLSLFCFSILFVAIFPDKYCISAFYSQQVVSVLGLFVNIYLGLGMATTKFFIENFEHNMSFAMWHIKMKAILRQIGLHKALFGKDHIPTALDEDKRIEICPYGIL
jgi:hypothetical protein